MGYTAKVRSSGLADLSRFLCVAQGFIPVRARRLIVPSGCGLRCHPMFMNDDVPIKARLLWNENKGYDPTLQVNVWRQGDQERAGIFGEHHTQKLLVCEVPAQ